MTNLDSTTTSELESLSRTAILHFSNLGITNSYIEQLKFIVEKYENGKDLNQLRMGN